MSDLSQVAAGREGGAATAANDEPGEPECAAERFATGESASAAIPATKRLAVQWLEVLSLAAQFLAADYKRRALAASHSTQSRSIKSNGILNIYKS